LLTRLVLKWAERIAPDQQGEAPLVANNPASALALADDLARLMDDMTTRGVAWERLDGLVPQACDRYWQLTLEFLQTARETWPKILAERGPIEPAAWCDALNKAEAAALAAPADGPAMAAATDAWKQLAGGDVPWIEGALQGLTVIEAANAEEEALAIAISLREAIETPAKTAALVTPDRALARRVLAALERWNVAVEDS